MTQQTKPATGQMSNMRQYLTDTNHLAYATASAVTESLGDLKTEGSFSTRTKLTEKMQRHFIEN